MRQRIRAVRAASNSPPVQIGVRLTRTGRSAARATGTAGSGGTVEVSGPYLVEIGSYAGYACTWVVWMRGAAVTTWALTWDGMEAEPTEVSFDPSFAADDSVQIALTNVSVSNLVVYATVDGTVYASEPVACAI